jgi:hypothetical protein
LESEKLAVSGAKRPVAVWLIFLFYVFSFSWTLLGFVLMYTGTVPLNEAQKAYFAHLTLFDHVTTAILLATNATAAILLFRLRETAVPLFAAAFLLNLGLTIRAIFGPYWIKAIGSGGLAGYFGLVIGLAILLYTVSLRRRGILC